MAQEVIVLKSRSSGKGAARAARRDNLVPAVVYGKSISPVAVSLDVLASRKMMVGIGTHIHHVTIEGTDFEGDVMVQDAVFESISRKPLHFDLHKISLTEKVKTEVPVTVIGETALDKTGLVLQRQLRQISIECLPTDIPSTLEIDVSNLGHGESITAGEVALPSGVRLVTPPAEVVVVAVAPRATEEKAAEEAAETVEATEPEEKAEKPE
mgnify:CR=1 FL=1